MPDKTTSLCRVAEKHCAEARAAGLLRTLVTGDVKKKAPLYMQRQDKTLLTFASNDYFGLSQHPKLVCAGIKASKRYGVGAGASRFITGNHPLYTQLETAIAQYTGTQKALVFGSGYLANIGAIPALVDKGDMVLYDALSHACMVDGIKLSGAKALRFAHNDRADLEQKLQRYRGSFRHVLIATETVFSMDGDTSPMQSINQLAEAYDAWSYSDNAHGLGITDTQLPKAMVQMGTLSKAMGSYGGYVAAAVPVIDWISQQARSAIFTTALPPATVATALAAFDQLAKHGQVWREELLRNIALFYQLSGLPASAILTPIIPVIVKGNHGVLEISQQLQNEYGIYVPAIRYPTVPKGQERLRITLSRMHSAAMIKQLVQALRGLKVIA